MSILYSKKASAVMEEAFKIASDNSTVCGIPHVMKSLMETKDFKSAYKDSPEHTYEDLKKFVDHAVKVYFPEETFDKIGDDWDMVENVILPKISYTIKKIMPSTGITIAHLFLAVCTETKYMQLDSYLNAHGVDKAKLFVDIATFEEVSSALINKDDLELLNSTYIYEDGKVQNLTLKKPKPEETPKSKSVTIRDPLEGLLNAMFGVPILSTVSMPIGMRIDEDDEDKDDEDDGFKSEYCTNLVEKAKEYKKPFIGREDIIERTMQILCKAEKSNPVHVGEAGVGKSAITLGLAKMIADGKVPDILKDSDLYELDLAALLAGTKYRGDFEAKLKYLLDSFEKLEKPILYIDEIHMIIGAGAAGNDNAIDAANILKPYLTKDKIKFIGATTYNEYKKYIEKDPALARRFQKIDVMEPSVEDTIIILKGLKANYETYHKVSYTDEAIEAAVTLTNRHIHDRFLPDKAIDMLDEAGAYRNIHPEYGSIITVDDISDVICKVRNIPKKILKGDTLRVVSDLETTLNQKVFGQEEAVRKVTESIQLSKSGLGDENKPIGVFLFVGPSGVGKTELAKTISESMSMNLLRFDMSEYAERHTVSKLIGSPAGYVGYDDGGLLTNALLKTPNSVLLLDEIEKAHPAIFNSFLQMFDYGMLTDSQGKKIDCRNTIIIMTSNAGVEASTKPAIGFGKNDDVNKSAINTAVNDLFSPEFRNRLSGIITFNGLNHEMSLLIAQKEIDELAEKLNGKNIEATFTERCINKIAELGTSPEFGARQLKRVIDTKIRRLFVKAIVANAAPESCVVDYVDDEFKIIS